MCIEEERVIINVDSNSSSIIIEEPTGSISLKDANLSTDPQ